MQYFSFLFSATPQSAFSDKNFSSLQYGIDTICGSEPIFHPVIFGIDAVYLTGFLFVLFLIFGAMFLLFGYLLFRRDQDGGRLALMKRVSFVGMLCTLFMTNFFAIFHDVRLRMPNQSFYDQHDKWSVCSHKLSDRWDNEKTIEENIQALKKGGLKLSLAGDLK